MNKPAKILSIVVIVILCLFLLRGKVSHKTFDSSKWKNADMHLEENWSLRWDMMNSLRNNYELVGMQKADVIALLGPSGDEAESTIITYDLGYAHDGIDTGLLTITFDKKGIVTNIRVSKG